MERHKQYEEIVNEDYIKSMKRAIDNNNQLTDAQKNVLREYRDDLESQVPMNFVDESGRFNKLRPIKSIKSLDTYIRKVVKLLEFLNKEVPDITKQDIRNYRLHLKNETISSRNSYNYQSEKNNRTMSNVTIEFYFTVIKRFFIWYYNKDEGTTILPDLVRNFHREPIHREKLDQSKLIFPSEVKLFINNSNKMKYKAFFSLLYESAGRIGEIMNCNISSFEDFEHFGKIRLKGKTGVRKVPISDSLYYLRQWINEHPYKDDKDAPLFLSHCKTHMFKRITYSGVRKIINSIAKQIGFKKKHNPHWWRHSSLDHLFRTSGINEYDLRIFAGWTPTSNMMEIYVHYDEDGVADKILKSKGKTLNLKTKDDLVLLPKICNKCRELFPEDPRKWEHPPTARYCTCGMVLDKSEIISIDKLKKEEGDFMLDLLEHPIVQSKPNSNMEEAMLESIMNNPSLLSKFRKVLLDNELM